MTFHEFRAFRLTSFPSACRTELQRLRAHLNDLERMVRERQTNLKDCEQAIARHKRDSRELRIEMQRVEEHVENLQDALERDSLEEGKLDALKEGLKEAEEELTTHQASYSDSVVAMDKAKEVLRVCREEMSAIDSEVAEIQAKIRKAENKKIKSSERRETALRNKNAAFADLEELQKTKEKGERQREGCANTVEVWTEQANRIHPRVPVEAGETPRSIEKKLDKLQADLQKWETRSVNDAPLLLRTVSLYGYRLGGNRQQIAEAAASKVRAFQKAKRQVEDVERLAQVW